MRRRGILYRLLGSCDGDGEKGSSPGGESVWGGILHAANTKLHAVPLALLQSKAKQNHLLAQLLKRTVLSAAMAVSPGHRVEVSMDQPLN